MPFLRGWFEWVEAFPSSIAFRESQYVYPATLTTHVVGMCLFVGLIVMMDLRLVGVANRSTPVTQVQKRLFPWQMAGMALSAITGLVLVYGQPMRFYGNVFFWIKMTMMALAGLNAWVFHRGTYHSVMRWDAAAQMPAGAKLAGAASVVLWTGIVVSGRLIAYNWFQ